MRNRLWSLLVDHHRKQCKVDQGIHILAYDAGTKRQLGYGKIGRVTIGNNVFIGAVSIVLPNVKIGDNTIIAPEASP